LTSLRHAAVGGLALTLASTSPAPAAPSVLDLGFTTGATPRIAADGAVFASVPHPVQPYSRLVLHTSTGGLIQLDAAMPADFTAVAIAGRASNANAASITDRYDLAATALTPAGERGFRFEHALGFVPLAEPNTPSVVRALAPASIAASDDSKPIAIGAVAWPANDRVSVGMLAAAFGPAGEAEPLMDPAMASHGASVAVAADVSGRRAVAFTPSDPAAPERAFIVDATGELLELPSLAPSGSTGAAYVRDLNDTAHAVGAATAGPGQPVRPVLFDLASAGAPTDLGLLPAWDIAQADAVNNAGVVVGVATMFEPLGVRTDAFVWTADLGPRSLDEFVPEPWRDRLDLTAAHDLNDAGQIVASALLDGEPTTVVLTVPSFSIPSPGTLTLAAFAVCAVGRRRR
jgi:hypothetical protein